MRCCWCNRELEKQSYGFSCWATSQRLCRYGTLLGYTMGAYYRITTSINDNIWLIIGTKDGTKIVSIPNGSNLMVMPFVRLPFDKNFNSEFDKLKDKISKMMLLM